MVLVQLHLCDVLVTKTVVLMKNVFNLVNVFANPHFSLTPKMETNARAHVNDSNVASMLNALQPIHRNVSARLATKEILKLLAWMSMNVKEILVALKLCV